MKLKNILIVVKDIEKSKQFYHLKIGKFISQGTVCQSTYDA